LLSPEQSAIGDSRARLVVLRARFDTRSRIKTRKDEHANRRLAAFFFRLRRLFFPAKLANGVIRLKARLFGGYFRTTDARPSSFYRSAEHPASSAFKLSAS
jgi:hypothetical protein